MNADWFVTVKGKEHGPFTESQLLKLVEKKQIGPNDKLRRAGGPLVAAVEVDGLFPAESRLPAAAGSPAPVSAHVAAPIPTAIAEPVMAAPLPAAQVVQPAAQQVAGASHRPTARRPAAGNQLMLTGAAILVGAAAAVVIYINLEGLENRIFGRKSNTEETDATANTETPASTPVTSSPPRTTPQLAQPSTTVRVVSVPAQAPATTPSSATPTTSIMATPATTPSTAASQFDAESVARLRNGLVSVMSGSRSMPGVLIDDAGHVLTMLNPMFSQFPPSIRFPLDGSQAQVEGYAAAIAGKRLLLLKTTAVGRGPLPKISANSASAARLHAVSPSADPQPKVDWTGTGGSTITWDQMDSDRGLYVTQPTTLDRDCALIRLDHAQYLMPSGQILIDDAGDIAGIKIAATSNPAVSLSVDVAQLVELIAQQSPTLRPLSELKFFRTTDGVVTMSSSPSSPPRPAFGPSTTSGTPTPQMAVASNTPASNPSTNAAASSTSAPAPSISTPLPAAGTPPGMLDPQQWIARMQDIDSRKGKLKDDYDAVMRNYEPLFREASGLQADLKRLDTQFKAVRRQYSSTVKALNDLLQLRDVGQDVSSVAISNLRSQASSLESDARSLENQASPIQRRLNEIGPPLAEETKKLELLYVDAERLRREYFDHMQPFGPPSAARGEAAVHYFTNLIPQTGDAGYPIFGRGCAQLVKGDSAAALADLNNAVTLQPKDPMFLAVRGVAKIRSGDEAGGRKDLSDSLKVDPKCYLARYLYSVTLLCGPKSAPQIAEAQIREAIKLDAENPDGLRMMGLLKCACSDDRLRKSDFGLKNAQQAYDAAATPANTITLAAALADNGKFDEALSYAQRAAGSVVEPTRAAWYRKCIETFQAKQPLRINFQEFDWWTTL